MMKKFSLLFFVMAALLMIAPPASAGNEGGSDYAYPYAPGMRQGSDGSVDPYATATVIILTGEDIIARGARTAADALRLATGSFSYANGNNEDRAERYLSMRGAETTQMTVFMDGLPLDNALFGTVDLNAIPADQIALIRIFSGPAPITFGAEGSGAVVEIVTREAHERLNARFDARFGDKRSGYFSAGLGDTHHWFQYYAMADHDSADGAIVSQNFDPDLNEEGGTRDNSAYRRGHYLGRVGVLMSEQAEAHLTFLYDNLEREAPVAVDLADSEYTRYPEQTRMGGLLHAQLGSFGPYQARARGFLVDYNERRNDFTDADYTELLRRRDTRNLRTGAGLLQVLDFGPYSRISADVSIQRDDIDYQVEGIVHERLKLQKAQASLVDDIKPLPWLHLSLGGGFAQLNPTYALYAERRDVLSGAHYRGGVACGPFSGVTMRLAAGNNLRFPTTVEWFDPVTGDAELDVANVQNFEGGIRYQPLTGTWFDIVGFMRRIDDGYGIQAVDQDDVPTVSDDTVSYRTTGFTFSFETAPIRGLWFGGNITYLQNQDDQDGWRTVYPLYIPMMNGSGEARYRFDLGLGASIWAEFAGERLDYDRGEVQELPWYLLTGARVFYSFRDRIEVYVQGSNLGDVYYETSAFYPEPGRMLEAGLKLTY